MSTAKQARPVSAVLLMVVLVFLSLGGLYGGVMLILDPSGGLLKIPLYLLARTPFGDYLIPGLILFFVLGLFPLGISIALWTLPTWKTVRGLEQIFKEHWAWVGAGVVAVALLIWLTVELWLVGYSFLLLVYSVVGVIILALTLLPSTRRYYRV